MGLKIDDTVDKSLARCDSSKQTRQNAAKTGSGIFRFLFKDALETKF